MVDIGYGDAQFLAGFDCVGDVLVEALVESPPVRNRRQRIIHTLVLRLFQFLVQGLQLLLGFIQTLAQLLRGFRHSSIVLDQP